MSFDSAHIHLLACPFCSRRPPDDLADTLYPSGIYWREHAEGFRSYHSRTEYKEGDQRCWKLTCDCGCMMSADSQEETVDRWNTRDKHTYSQAEVAWLRTGEKLAAINSAFCAIHETPSKEQTEQQKEALKSLRAQATSLHYERIALCQVQRRRQTAP